ncbi:MAG: S1 RNA-binding domain-containing protein [Chloroflexota bacterium]|nr:S1 RNA-binding domain-containing protein [Chloroflexota bacterium]
MDQPRTDMQEQLSALIEGDYDYTLPKRGDICEAVILFVGKDEVIVDVGGKRDGVVPRKDLQLLDESYRAGLRAGDCVPVRIRDIHASGDGIVVSLSEGLAEQDWLRAEELLEDGEVCEAEVTDVNSGGVLVSFGRVRGFVPNSHLSSVPPGLRGSRLQEAKSDLVGNTLTLTVLEVEQRRRRLVLSERAANQRRRQKLLNELEEDGVRAGVVRNLVEYGAFVDLGGVDGLIHISELDWRHLDHPSDVLSIGDEVEVKILSVDRQRERIELSRKELLPDPWPAVVGELEVDQVVEGRVTNIVDFGAFVDVGQGVEGLVHTSEMPSGKVTCVRLSRETPIQVRVLDIDSSKRRLALSMRGVPSVTFSREEAVDRSVA